MSGRMAAGSVVRQALAVQRHTVRRFDATTNAAYLSRKDVDASLRAWGFSGLVETATLLVSELVTNACRASAQSSEFTAIVATRLTCTDTDLIIEVWDANGAAPMLEDRGLEAENGRGLLLVSALSTRWAFYRPRTGGKVTWCSVPLPNSADTVTIEAESLPSRPTKAAPAEPIEMFDNADVLRRVADGLQALDWDLPPGDQARP